MINEYPIIIDYYFILLSAIYITFGSVRIAFGINGDISIFILQSSFNLYIIVSKIKKLVITKLMIYNIML